GQRAWGRGAGRWGGFGGAGEVRWAPEPGADGEGVAPKHLHGPESLVLYNTLWHPEDAVIASGTIAAIRHSELGEVRKVDTRGLDYTITLAHGSELTVNAEEEPGKMYE